MPKEEQTLLSQRKKRAMDETFPFRFLVSTVILVCKQETGRRRRARLDTGNTAARQNDRFESRPSEPSTVARETGWGRRNFGDYIHLTYCISNMLGYNWQSWW